MLTGEWERVLVVDRSEPSISRPTALFLLGRVDEALGLVRPLLQKDLHPQLRLALTVMAAAFESKWDEVIESIHCLDHSGFFDPEGLFHWAGALAMAGDREGGLDMLERTVEGGFYPSSAFVTYPNLDPLRAMPDFRHIVRRAEERQRKALEAFRSAGGPQLLGLSHV
jgi:hypothetical protein